MVSAHRKALALMWRDRCTVYRYAEQTDPETHITRFRETAIIKNEPCKLSFETLETAEGSPAAAVVQSTKLFLSPDAEVPAGCKVIVIRPGSRTHRFVFASSGEPGVFSDHQEVMLTAWEGWA